MRTSFRPFCEKEDILRVPGDVLPVCVAGFTSGAGLRVWLRLASPVTADSSSSSSLRVTATDVLSTFMMRAGRGSGRWLLRQIQCLALFPEKEGGSELRDGAQHWGLYFVFSSSSRVFLSKASFSSVNWGEKHYIRIPVAFRLYLVKIIQILTN
jgi:hypothetical protein